MNGHRAQLARSLYWLEIAVLTFVAVLVFQLFLRYEYVGGAGTTWRIDRMTQQACEIRRAVTVCNLPSPAPVENDPERGLLALAK